MEGQWRDVSEVDTLKAMLEAQQQELQQLRTAHAGKPVQVPAPRKRKAAAEADGYGGGGDDDYCPGQDDDEVLLLEKDADWDPDADSDCDDAPKKRSSKKGSGSAGGKKKQAKRGSRRDSLGEDSEEYDDGRSTAAATAKAAAVALRSVRSSIKQQMVYRPSLKHGKSRVSLELPCLHEAVVAHMLGPELMARASNGKKQLQFKASSANLDEMYEGCHGFYKSLRYGATLGLIDGLTFTFNKTTSVLKVHGMYTMTR